jgi:UDP-N-acetylmuramoyl-tripeptide--D-alanyl-D-alanine ligase
MVELRLDQIAARVSGEIVQGSPSLTFRKFNIDSRLSEPGELFFAIVAKRNGHRFIADATARGARGAVVSEPVLPLSKDFGLVRVKDTVAALQELARAALSEQSIKVVGITGSIGKTTTKEFAAALLSPKFRLLKSEGNYNNCLGVALSLLRLEKGQEIALLEMGTSAPGEIRALTRMAAPDVAVVTNVNPVHLQFFGSLENIAAAKKEILEGAKEGGTAVLNYDDPFVKKMGEGWKGRIISFGLSRGCEVRSGAIRRRGFEGITFDLRYGRQSKKIRFPFLYESHLSNLLAALGVARAFSLPLRELEPIIHSLKPFSRRGAILRLSRQILLIDDSYNSSPKALEQALQGLAALPSKRKVAVLGDMLELGERESDFHNEAGKQLARWSWDVLVTVGALSQHMAKGAIAAGLKAGQVTSFRDSEEAAGEVAKILQEGDLVLVKGSRGIQMEKIVEKIKEVFKEA